MRLEDGSQSEAQHCFPVNPDGLEVEGVQGILEVGSMLYSYNFCAAVFNFASTSCLLLQCSSVHLLFDRWPFLPKAYKNGMPRLFFSGPTLFAPLINASSAIAAANNCWYDPVSFNSAPSHAFDFITCAFAVLLACSRMLALRLH